VGRRFDRHPLGEDALRRRERISASFADRESFLIAASRFDALDRFEWGSS